MKDSGIITNLTVKEFITKRETAFIRENFKQGSIMAMEKWNIKMEIDMKANIKMVKKTDKEFIHGPMEIIMMDNGKMIVLKEEGHQ